MTAPSLKLTGISKTYPGVRALDHMTSNACPARSTPC